LSQKESPTRDASIEPVAFAESLLAWYGDQGRELPWRQTRDPYRIWLSEIMLQQTGVAAVIPYYQHFLERYPHVAALAAAPIEEVVDLWAGLGYYSRARNLHATAGQIVARFHGHFPATLEELQSLPGVGRSTAGAIAALAFEKRAPILDGNVRRILCRLFAWQEDPATAVAQRQLWEWADHLTPATRVHDYTQAIMDLGATVCLPRNPRCSDCPVGRFCRAQTLGLEKLLPRRRPSKAVPTEAQVALILAWAGCVLVRRRPLHGLLGGLWEFPGRALVNGQSSEQAAAAELQERGVSGRLQAVGTIRHAYSHFRVQVDVFKVHVEKIEGVAEGGDGEQWLPEQVLPEMPLHGAHKKVLGLLHKKPGRSSGKENTIASQD